MFLWLMKEGEGEYISKVRHLLKAGQQHQLYLMKPFILMQWHSEGEQGRNEMRVDLNSEKTNVMYYPCDGCPYLIHSEKESCSKQGTASHVGCSSTKGWPAQSWNSFSKSPKKQDICHWKGINCFLFSLTTGKLRKLFPNPLSCEESRFSHHVLPFSPTSSSCLRFKDTHSLRLIGSDGRKNNL